MPKHGVRDASLAPAAGPACPRCPLKAPLPVRLRRWTVGHRMRDQASSSAQRPSEPGAGLVVVTLQLWMSCVLVALCGFTCMCWNPSRDRPHGSMGLLRSAPRRAQHPVPSRQLLILKKRARGLQVRKQRAWTAIPPPPPALSTWGASWCGRGPTWSVLAWPRTLPGSALSSFGHGSAPALCTPWSEALAAVGGGQSCHLSSRG